MQIVGPNTIKSMVTGTYSPKSIGILAPSETVCLDFGWQTAKPGIGILDAGHIG